MPCTSRTNQALRAEMSARRQACRLARYRKRRLRELPPNALWQGRGTSSPSLAHDEVRRLLHDQAKPLFDVRRAPENTLVACKKNVAATFGRDKHVLGIDSLQTKRE